ncbi:MAG: bifunctional methylenetetrahydrofolate dehydrogenase/methenyltetrahydrofolate cyclohydrolase FolD [Candidatus Paraimprobicoccus trichonymphae]|uniref:Bifunctional protein FolD n=1 Tax=Candidatus Paraimprobicoccus trichonymphae TaxID=3033793 RepID=A0AA48IH88_9FIRM|nr:MAG: bifunctional methylenetetrahydrofolate dehydrogenase/methenyltetrahydrofolate cyclohydrolase FolD [Candidatus Paraimprobicoccus trichonymphae]
MIINGKLLSETILKQVKKNVLTLKNEKNITPGLAVVIVGDNLASTIYVNNKQKVCEKVGIHSEKYNLPKNFSQIELINLIEELNNNHKINGILLQLPLPKHINERTVIEYINKNKDVDCFSSYNVGNLILGGQKVLPCTPSGIIELIKSTNTEISGKHCVIVGRSNIVGKPLALMLLQENATVSICHSKTVNLENLTKQADILISAVGKPKFIKKNMVKNNSIIIDVGINRLSNEKICGDVDFEGVFDKVSYITPVPGGVGPMTIAMLMKNTLNLTLI